LTIDAHRRALEGSGACPQNLSPSCCLYGRRSTVCSWAAERAARKVVREKRKAALKADAEKAKEKLHVS